MALSFQIDLISSVDKARSPFQVAASVALRISWSNYAATRVPG
jgi:hypothetical protein